MRIAVSRDGKTFGEPRRVLTPADFSEAMRQFQKIVEELTGGENITVAAGGVPGPLNRERSKLVHAPNLQGWIGKPLEDGIMSIVHSPVFLANDTALAGLGEVTRGAAKGYGIVAYVTVSTGVGGARIVRGAIDRSVFGFEIGHQYVDVDRTLAGGALCSCGEAGHLEGYISGTAFERRYGKKAFEIKDPAMWEEAAEILAYGLNNVIVHWSPDIVVLGGSMIMNDSAIQIDRVETYLKRIFKIFPELPVIKKAELGDDGGLYGALAYLRYMHHQD